MKGNFLFIGILFFLFISCKKNSDGPILKPTIDIKFGYYNNYKARCFDNQDSIFLKNLDGAFYFRISENNLTNPELVNKTSSDFDYTVSFETSQDKEVFVKGKNGWFLGGGSGYSNKNDIWYSAINIDFIMPLKITDKVIKGNDTIEIANTGDFVKSVYVSQFSKIQGVKNIKIKQY